ncbi:FadR/GntR family transcriptional regulator [Kitasatospora sp. NPDC051705]|uniref:FadR/GntR family transcriptional regulator n=1 Tax=Kitasatospora sp. NPDC051705 TaxID=3364057 RepID=UPI0037A92B8C
MSLTDRAIARIRRMIRDGELPPGAKLPPEQQLAAELGLSRNLMRKAVKALVVARVLEIRRGDGTYVTGLAPGLLLEGIGGAVELLQGGHDPGEDVDLLLQHDAAFHRAVVRATRNETPATLLEQISGRTLSARAWRGLADADAAGRTVAEHEAIHRALVARDADLARAAALVHVNTTERGLRDHLAEGERIPVARRPLPTGGTD